MRQNIVIVTRWDGRPVHLDFEDMKAASSYLLGQHPRGGTIQIVERIDQVQDGDTPQPTRWNHPAGVWIV